MVGSGTAPDEADGPNQTWSHIDAISTSDAIDVTGLTADELEQRQDLKWDNTWFSRMRCEREGLDRHRASDPPGYWLSIRQAATVLGVSRQLTDRLPLPVNRDGSGHKAVRREDVEQLGRSRSFRWRATWMSYADAVALTGQSDEWIRTQVARGLLGEHVSRRDGERYVERFGVERIVEQQRLNPPPPGIPVDRVVSDYLAGDGIVLIAARYSCSPTGVRSALQRAGIALRPRGGVRARITDEEIVRLRDDDRLSWVDMSAVTGMTEEGMRARYQQATGKKPATEWHRKAARHSSLTTTQLRELNSMIDQKAEIVEAYRSGRVTSFDLAAQHGISERTVRRWAEQLESNT